ncbi:hypothetical protein [Serratia aquatilis]|uniref:DUF3757 domain-containing protein n=1 Tax=Serratia aquatilis TaxID=1737515 RepID=A0ABV6EFV0_9GAMM
MKEFFILFIFVINIGCAHGEEGCGYIFFKGAELSIPPKWKVDEKNGCLNIKRHGSYDLESFEICKYTSSEGGYLFVRNEDDKWEAVTEGTPILADVNAISKFTGLSAIVSCRYKDDAGYHLEQCFQAEIFLPKNKGFTFIGKGDLNSFDIYKKIYLSLKIKGVE